MMELKDKKKLKEDDRFKPVPNPNYKPTTHKASIATIVDPLQNIIPIERNNSHQNSTPSSISSNNSNTSTISATNADIPRPITPKISMEQVVQSIRVEEPSNMTIQVEKPNFIVAQVEKPKETMAQANILKVNIPKANIFRAKSFKENTFGSNKPIAVVKTPRPSSTYRITPLYAMTPQAATNTISRRLSEMSRRSSLVSPPLPVPSTPRPSTAPIILDSEGGAEKKNANERWTISSNRKLEKLPVRVSNPNLNNRNSLVFSSKPLPAPPKNEEFRSSSGFENLECTASFYQPSLTKQPSWVSSQSIKVNQSQQNERALELTQNK
jgi:hypothetical protein